MTDIFAQARAEAEAHHRESVDYATRNDWWTDFPAAAAAYQPQNDPGLKGAASDYMRGRVYDPSRDAAYLMGRTQRAERALRDHLSGIISTSTDARLTDMVGDAYRALHDYIADHIMPIHNRLMDIHASRLEGME